MRSPLLIDKYLPVYDVVLARQVMVDADPVTVLQAVKELDFMAVHSPLLDAAMWLRGVPDRLARRASPPPSSLTLAGGVGLPGWLVLGERDGAEFSFGAVGKFWQPSIEWRDVPVAEFAGFDDPDWGKIACSFIVRPLGQYRCVLTYECRTATNGPVAGRKFRRYWWLIKPFVGHIMRATLAKLAVDARERSRALHATA